jgi:hypothetical protein
MRTERRTAFLTGLAVAGCLALALACKDSNMVSAPAAGSPTAASLAGTWSGNFQPDSSTCARSSVTATFEQTGAQVTGHFTSGSCGPSGAFRGTVEGNRVTGSIEMLGCTGGGVSGMVDASGLTLDIGDLTRPLVTGNAVVMPGGTATLRR